MLCECDHLQDLGSISLFFKQPIVWEHACRNLVKKQTLFTAVVLAADRELDNPVRSSGGNTSCKAFAPVRGVPMVLRVLDALKNSDSVGKCVLCGPAWPLIERENELRNRITSGQLTWINHEATPSSSAYKVMQSLPSDTPVLLTTSDHAMLSPKIVDYFCRQARESDRDVVAALVPPQIS